MSYPAFDALRAGTATEPDTDLQSAWDALWRELERSQNAERRHSEESQQLAATILTNMGTGLVMLNARGLITESNPAARAVLEQRKLVNRHYREVFWPGWNPPDEQPPGMAELAFGLNDGQPVRRLRITYVSPSGHRMTLGVGFSPIRSSTGVIGGAICLLTDLTEITALQEQVRLKENMAVLGEMSAGIAHEFKNSLATISGYAQLIEMTGQLPEARQFAAKIHQETRLLARVVTDFLNLSRPIELTAQPADLRELVEESFAEIAARLAGSTAALVLEGEFPVIRADITLLRQAFSNIIRNAVEAMSGQPERLLRVRSRAESSTAGRCVVLAFIDQGVGIPAGNLGKVFIPFFTTKDTGTGLGLSLVHKVIANHQGKITVESEPGHGAVFTVTLPLGDQD